MEKRAVYHLRDNEIFLSDAISFILEPLAYSIEANTDESNQCAVVSALFDHARNELRKLCQGVDTALGGSLLVKAREVRTGAVGEVEGVRVMHPTPIDNAGWMANSDCIVES